VPPPQKNFQFWGLERRILVHSVALLTADCTAAFYTVIYSADAISTHKIRERTLSRTVLLHYNYVGKSITFLMVNV